MMFKMSNAWMGAKRWCALGLALGLTLSAQAAWAAPNAKRKPSGKAKAAAVAAAPAVAMHYDRPAVAMAGVQPPVIAAPLFFLLDASTGQVLAERGPDVQAEPASLTKLMTAYVVFVALKERRIGIDQAMNVSERAWSERKGGGSLMFIEPRMRPTVKELLQGMIVQSGNDASVALAEGVAGSVEAFVDMMNRQAQAFGLKGTQFRNVTGLTEAGHFSTPRDLAVLAQRIIQDFPEHYAAYYSMKAYTFNDITQPNRNLLLGRDPTVDGMKTGFTDKAKYCLIASAQRDLPAGKRRLISVVMGAESLEARAVESQKLLNWGYQAWDTVKLADEGAVLTQARVWKGTANELPLGVDGALMVSVPRGEGAKLKTEVTRQEPLLAPIAKGQAVGELKVIMPNGTVVVQRPLMAQRPVALAGFFGRAWDSLRLWIQ